MQTEFTGRIWKFDDDIDTDIIIPTQHLNLSTMEEMSSHLFEPLRPTLAAQLQKGDIIVAGDNFGCGSSREQAAELLAYKGIKCIIAKSFARIFFRNAINNGVLLIENNQLADVVKEGETITVKINKCVSYEGINYPIPRIAANIFEIIEDGGLVKHTQKINGVEGRKA